MNKIIKQIEQAQTIALFTHILPDADALGSVFSMHRTLTQMGKKADLYINEKISQRLCFLADMAQVPYCVEPQDKAYDLCLSLDCGDLERLGDFKDLYQRGKVTANLDHHISNTSFAMVNYVNGEACSTGELVYELLQHMGKTPDEITASLVYAAIAADTGCFVFSNTNVNAHLYAAALLRLGAQTAKINKLLFNTNDLAALRVRAYAIDHFEFFKEQKIAVVVLTEEILKQLGATDEDAEGLTDLPRSVRGVEVGVVIRERKGKSKVSIRTNQYINASEVAAHFGGGGHAKAAGCVSEENVYDTRDRLVHILEELV